MKRLLASLAVALLALPAVAHAELPADIAKAIAAMGHALNVPQTLKLFMPLQPKDPVAGLKAERDLAYGSDPLQKLDVVYDGNGANKPVVVFVRGGGFQGGDKHAPGSFAFDNIMKWAVDHGMVGVNINYRLAPKNKYPDAVMDVRDALAWAAENATKYGGDPNKIFLWGHSAGASLVGMYVSHPQFHYRQGGGIIGAVMGSGGFVASPNAFFGNDPAVIKAASSVEGLKETSIPLFFTRAEWDPEGIIAGNETMNKVLTDAGRDHVFIVMKGHNHMSQLYSIGIGEGQMTDVLAPWMKKLAGNVKSASN